MLPIPSAITGKVNDITSHTSLAKGIVEKLPKRLLKFAPELISKANHLPLSVRSGVINTIPRLLTPAFALLPFSAQQKLLLPALTSVFKEALEDGDFEFLQDKWLRISITDLDINWWLSFDKGKLIMAPQKQFSVENSSNSSTNSSEDVSFSASGDDLLLIAGRKQDPDTLFFQRRLKIEGDTELGLELKNLIDALDIEQLPGVVHDLVAASAELVQQTQTELANAKP